MQKTVSVDVGGKAMSFDLDFSPDERGKWSGPKPAESDFPLVVESEGRRFELYSDGTFAEVELGKE